MINLALLKRQPKVFKVAFSFNMPRFPPPIVATTIWVNRYNFIPWSKFPFPILSLNIGEIVHLSLGGVNYCWVLGIWLCRNMFSLHLHSFMLFSLHVRVFLVYLVLVFSVVDIKSGLYELFLNICDRDLTEWLVHSFDYAWYFFQPLCTYFANL